MFDLELIGEIGIPESELQQIARLICEQEDPLHDYRISLKIVDSEEMQKLNRVYRGKDETTDVLSFVSEDIEMGWIPSSAGMTIGVDSITKESNSTSQIENEGLNLPIRLCDIIVDTKQLVKQKGNRTFNDEFRFVFIHGLLHLVGYDHVRSRDSEEMRNKENIYLKQLQGEKISGRR
ncbi:MAG: rRNA maturation RNase YbeY [Candidatus Cloacimonas sp.]|jgi:probable rRNA maturation factor|nr:rRNA maturation RNase YbeY [Candidatus Cloacimonas sp.]